MKNCVNFLTLRNLVSQKKLSFLLLIGVGLLFAYSAEAAAASFHIRYQDTLFFEGEAELPSTGTVTLTDEDGVGHEVNSRSVLALLSSLDTASNSFSISRLQYFSAFNSFYLKCMQIPSISAEQCDNWQYVVNGTYPSVGMDSYVLSGGENVWVYFGNIRIVIGPDRGYTQTPLSFTAQTYQYEANGWVPVSGYTIGLKRDGVEVATQAVDSQGKAMLTVTQSGNYIAGITEDFYFPSTPFAVDLFVPSAGATGGSSSQSASGTPPEQTSLSSEKFDTSRAIQFLSSQQRSDGSFGAPLLSDWAAVAFASQDQAFPAKERLKRYLLEDPSPGSFLSDYERRAMALMALGVNPYSGAKTDYITHIVSSFDGIQFGDPAFVSDDIFALLVLLQAGYDPAEEIPRKGVSFVLSQQKENGSFAESVDMTSAAVQTLSLANSEKEVAFATERAKAYLASKEMPDGSFGNVYSTSWAMQAMSVKEQNLVYLGSRQAEDGGMEEKESPENRVWATLYAIPAAQGKSWSVILQDFRKPQRGELVPQVFGEQSNSGMIESELSRISKEVNAMAEHIAKEHTPYRFAVREQGSAPSLKISSPQEDTTSLEKGEKALPVDLLGESNLAAEAGSTKGRIDIIALGLVAVAFVLATALIGGMSNMFAMWKGIKIAFQKRS